MDGEMRVLLTGASSLLGRYLLSTAPAAYHISGTWYTRPASCPGPAYQMNVTDRSQVRYVFGLVKPDIVIHCAADGSVDRAEEHYQEARAVNVGGVANVVGEAQEYGAKVVYISSNAVYDGFHPPYNEESPQRPINNYGRLKSQAEMIVRDSPRWLIIRPFLLYGNPASGGRHNWATTIIQRLSYGEAAPMVNDVTWMPTYAGDCAATIWRLLEIENQSFNVGAPARVTLYEFARKVAATWGLDAGLIEPVGSDYFKGIAPRPRDTTYDLSKIDGLGIRLAGVDEGLAKMKGEK